MGRTVSRFRCYTTADIAPSVVTSPGVYGALHPNGGTQLRAADGRGASQSGGTPGTCRTSGGACSVFNARAAAPLVASPGAAGRARRMRRSPGPPPASGAGSRHRFTKFSAKGAFP